MRPWATVAPITMPLRDRSTQTALGSDLRVATFSTTLVPTASSGSSPAAAASPAPRGGWEAGGGGGAARVGALLGETGVRRGLPGGPARWWAGAGTVERGGRREGELTRATYLAAPYRFWSLSFSFSASLELAFFRTHAVSVRRVGLGE